MALRLITAPTVEPVSLTEAKAHLRVSITDDDTLITGLIVAARQQAEAITRRCFITQTWELILDAFPTAIEIPLPPLQSVTSIKYIDTAGSQQTLGASVYVVHTENEPGLITLAYGQVWPSLRGDVGGIVVRFVAGYGPLTGDQAGQETARVPESIKNAIKFEVERLYERDSRTMDALAAARDALLGPYRVLRF